MSEAIKYYKLPDGSVIGIAFDAQPPEDAVECEAPGSEPHGKAP